MPEVRIACNPPRKSDLSVNLRNGPDGNSGPRMKKKAIHRNSLQLGYEKSVYTLLPRKGTVCKGKVASYCTFFILFSILILSAKQNNITPKLKQKLKYKHAKSEDEHKTGPLDAL